jgi:Zn finger protein HypA/HybF involved in hydrogenase expression
MIIESAIERYRFECRNCGHTWADDYTVQYVEDSEGSLWSFYRLEGIPVISPTAHDLICPQCHHTQVAEDLVGRREVPLASLERDEPRQQVTGTREQRRESAPELPGEVRLTRVTSEESAD